MYLTFERKDLLAHIAGVVTISGGMWVRLGDGGGGGGNVHEDEQLLHLVIHPFSIIYE